MREASTPVVREFETWLSLFTDGALPESDRWKAWFCVAEYELADFEAVASMLEDHGSAGSFAFLGRDAETQAESIETVDAAGHEVVFHSHRHHQYGDLSYDEAHDAITTGMGAIEDATGITPNGFFAPFLRLSNGTVRAIEEVGFDWVLGSTDQEAEGVTIHEPVMPFDTRLLEDHDPATAMEQLEADAAGGGAPFLFHPPVIEYYDGLDAFEGWIDAVEPVTVAEQLQTGGAGVVLDCVRPVRVE